MVAADFQTILAALTLLERQPDGRYPQRRESQASWLLPLTEYVQADNNRGGPGARRLRW